MEDGHAGQSRQYLLQEFELLADDLPVDSRRTCDVAAGPSQAFGKALSNWIRGTGSDEDGDLLRGVEGRSDCVAAIGDVAEVLKRLAERIEHRRFSGRCHREDSYAPQFPLLLRISARHKNEAESEHEPDHPQWAPRLGRLAGSLADDDGSQEPAALGEHCHCDERVAP